jgi:hypothetical protein
MWGFPKLLMSKNIASKTENETWNVARSRGSKLHKIIVLTCGRRRKITEIKIM